MTQICGMQPEWLEVGTGRGVHRHEQLVTCAHLAPGINPSWLSTGKLAMLEEYTRAQKTCGHFTDPVSLQVHDYI